MNALQLITALAEQAYTYLDLTDEQEKQLANFEVRIAQQPTWPFEYNVGTVAGPSDIEAVMTDVDCPEHPEYMLGHAGCDVELSEVEAPSVIYIGEAGQIGYLPGDVAKALGWR